MGNIHGNSILTVKQMRMAEQYATAVDKIPNLKLIEFAGQAVANAAIKYRVDAGRVVFVVGKGNNSSDAFAAARFLRLKQRPVTVVPLFPLIELGADLQYQVECAMEAGVKIRPATCSQDLSILQGWLSRAVMVVDAIFGTGLTSPITGWVAQAVQQVNGIHCPILAVDIPSGIDADSGEVLGVAIHADFTLPIAAYKWGHWLQVGKACRGIILPPATIGIRKQVIGKMLKEYASSAASSQLIHTDMIQAAFPKRSPQAFKQSFGHLWVLGGSIGYTGAPRLAALGAQAVSTGLVSIACPHDIYPIVASASLEVMVHPQEQQPWQNTAHAIVAGPGWGERQRDMLMAALRHDIPTVLDAEALNILAHDKAIQDVLKTRTAVAVLTPHPGEAATLLDLTSAEVQEDRRSAALALVDLYQSWIVLKGEQTLVVSPAKDVWLNPFGSVNLATAGTGDVLAGMIGGLLAAKLSADIAVPAAVGLHGLAGEEKDWFRAGQLETVIAKKVQCFRDCNYSAHP